jgi:hypothetical protein
VLAAPIFALKSPMRTVMSLSFFLFSTASSCWWSHPSSLQNHSLVYNTGWYAYWFFLIGGKFYCHIVWTDSLPPNK